MTYTIRRAVALAVLTGLAGVIAITEPHRHLIAWAWPFVLDAYSFITAI
jgi:hypothetical protein